MIGVLVRAVAVAARVICCLVILLLLLLFAPVGVVVVVVTVVGIVVISLGSIFPSLLIIPCQRNIILVMEESQMRARAFPALGSDARTEP